MSGSPPPPPTSSSTSPSATRLTALYSASTLVQGNSSFGFQGVYPPYQPITGHDSNNASPNTTTTIKREQDLKKRRVSDSRRQRTPMSCDRCKIRKIKVRPRRRVMMLISFSSASIQIQDRVITVLV